MNSQLVQEDGKILVSLREAARLLSISERTLYTLIKDGQIPTVRLKRAVRIRVCDLEDWTAARVQPFVPGPVPGKRIV